MIVLNPLPLAAACSFYILYKDPGVNHHKELFLPGENPVGFTKRIIAACVEIFTIRLTKDAEPIIGDCALHDPDDRRHELETGGSLLPAFQRKGNMPMAFSLLEQRAREYDPMQYLSTKTEHNNGSAALGGKRHDHFC